MSELANRIIQALIACYQVDWSVAEGRILHDTRQYDPTIRHLYRFPHEFDAAMRELEQAKYIEKHPIFPDWRILKFPTL